MREEINYQKFSEEERSFFNSLVDKYEGVEQDIEHLIVKHKDGSESRILKTMIRKGYLETKSRGKIGAEDYIEELLAKDNNPEDVNA